MSDTAVLVVDMLNTYQHPDAELLVPNVEKIIDPLADFVSNARESTTSTWCMSTLDAYVRHFPVVIPSDAVAHIDAELGAAALKMMERNMSAELTTSADCLG